MEKQIDFNGEWSNEYDDTAQHIIPAYQAIYELAQHLLREQVGAQANILVAGAGTGKEIIDWSRINPQWSFTGVDPAKPMISIAQKKVGSAHFESRISFVHGLVKDVAEKDFDAATAILVMQFLQDDGGKLEFLRDIADKLKPGAPVILVDLEGEIGSDEYNIFDTAWKNHQFFNRDDSTRVRKEFAIREKEVQFVSSVRIKSLLTEAGFIKIHRFFKAYLFGGYVAVKK